MDGVALIIGISWTVFGLLCIGLAVPLVRGQVSPNAFYGVRFRQSYQSDRAWYAINRFGGKRLIGWSIPVSLTGIVSFFLPLQSHPALALTLGFAPLIFVFMPLLQTWRFARRYRG